MFILTKHIPQHMEITSNASGLLIWQPVLLKEERQRERANVAENWHLIYRKTGGMDLDRLSSWKTDKENKSNFGGILRLSCSYLNPNPNKCLDGCEPLKGKEPAGNDLV